MNATSHGWRQCFNGFFNVVPARTLASGVILRQDVVVRLVPRILPSAGVYAACLPDGYMGCSVF